MSATTLPGLIGSAFEQLVGALLLLALGPLEPVGRLVAHDAGDLAAHVELADAVGVVDLLYAYFATGGPAARPGSAQQQGNRHRQDRGYPEHETSPCSKRHRACPGVICIRRGETPSLVYEQRACG